jgi:hypothetical protein
MRPCPRCAQTESTTCCSGIEPKDPAECLWCGESLPTGRAFCGVGCWTDYGQDFQAEVLGPKPAPKAPPRAAPTQIARHQWAKRGGSAAVCNRCGMQRRVREGSGGVREIVYRRRQGKWSTRLLTCLRVFKSSSKKAGHP